MNQTFKNLLAAAIVATILLVAWGIETLRDSRPGLFARLCLWAVVVGIVALVLALTVHFAHARDLDGRYAGSPLKEWFDNLKSNSGALCCSDADGTALSDVDWETKDGRYRVRIEGEWVDVPDSAVIHEPNRAGRTMVWPLRGYMGLTIRCFMPGSLS